MMPCFFVTREGIAADSHARKFRVRREAIDQPRAAGLADRELAHEARDAGMLAGDVEPPVQALSGVGRVIPSLAVRAWLAVRAGIGHHIGGWQHDRFFVPRRSALAPGRRAHG